MSSLNRHHISGKPYFTGYPEIFLFYWLQIGNNAEYWIKKISRNRERDDEVNKRLLFEGWTVIRFWGRDIRQHTDECIKVIEETIFDLIMQEKKDI